MRLHGGSLTVTSKSAAEASPNESHGSTFTVTLPLGTEHLVSSQIDGARLNVTAHSYARAVVEEAARWSGKNLLAQDDDTEQSGTVSSDSASRASSLENFGVFFQKSDIVLLG